jgi:hypothetical protein
MAIGRYRDRPAEMDDLECRVAAAQYPGGGLVLGMGLGIVLGMVLSPGAVAVGPIVGALAGYGPSRVFRGYRLRQLRASVDTGEGGEADGSTDGADTVSPVDAEAGEHHGDSA